MTDLAHQLLSKLEDLAPDNVPALGELLVPFEELAEQLEPELALVATAIGAALENIILMDDSDPKASLNHAKEDLVKIIAWDEKGERPKSFHFGNTPKSEGQSPENEAMIQAFLSEEGDKIIELESLIMDFEKDDLKESALKNIRKILHTIKGDSGVLSIKRIAEGVHQAENQLEDPKKVDADFLIQVKDWLSQCLQELEHGGVQAITSLEDYIKEAKAALPVPPSMLVTGPMEIVEDFISESVDHMETLDKNLLTLEDNPEDTEAINTCFRAIHTVKGVAGFIGAEPIAELSHITETLLDRTRKKQLSLQGAAMDVVFESVDLLKAMIESMRQPNNKGELFCLNTGRPELVRKIEAVLDGKTPADKETKKTMPTALEDASISTSEAMDIAVASTAAEAKAKGEKDNNSSSQQIRAREFLKVDVQKIDYLVESIGELVIAESMVLHDPDLQDKILNSQTLQKNVAQMSYISRTLQDMAVMMRLVPLQSTFQKMQRLVRDVARNLNKKVDFVMEGGDTELDRNIAEKIGDPLVHMLRNALDHGLETEEERLASGKKPEGKVHLKAYQKGSTIILEISDDGRGIDAKVILNKAIEKGLANADQELSSEEIFRFIFHAGFSTAKKITDVSGRGVGMDVVRSNIESLGGSVSIHSELGSGSLFRITLPLTMAIIEGMLIRVGEERFFIPLLSILESLQLNKLPISTVAGRGESVTVRNEIVPLVYLNQVFGYPQKEASDNLMVVIIENASTRVGFVVDELLGQHQVVIKSLGHFFGKIRGVSGATIMSDGSIGLVLDPSELIKMATQNHLSPAGSL